MIQAWKCWMYARGSWRMITRDGGKEYLERFYLWSMRWLHWLRLPESGFLHTFYMDDPDPPHDHPWPWGRMILRGRYREHYHDGTYQDCGPGHVVWHRSAIALHRVELLDGPVTTIFWHWRRERKWGFLYPDGWRPVTEEGSGGRPMRGWIFPRKVGPPPQEVRLD